jgi:hypothetical protein
MHIPVEPNLDKPVPPPGAQKQRGRTKSERMKIAGNTALLLKELGMDENVTPEEEARAKAMFAKMDEMDDKSKPDEEEAELKDPNIAVTLGSYISEYEKQIVADKIQVRTVVVNRLMEISKDKDNRTALKALELLGKASDLFTERSEITITHQTSDELKAAIKERIAQLMQMQKLDTKSKTENRLAQLKHDKENVVDVEAKEK